MKRPTTLVVFDYDGVIVDSLAVFVRCIAEVCREMQHPGRLDAEQIQALDTITFAEFARVLELDRPLWRPFVKRLAERTEAAMDEIRVFEAMGPVIEGLAARHSLAVVSASTASVIRKVLARNGLERSFDAVVGGDTRGPKSEKIERLVAQGGWSAPGSLMVGDAVSDVREARLAGVQSVAVGWGWHPRERLQREAPTHFVSHPEELLDLLA